MGVIIVPTGPPSSPELSGLSYWTEKSRPDFVKMLNARSGRNDPADEVLGSIPRVVELPTGWGSLASWIGKLLRMALEDDFWRPQTHLHMHLSAHLHICL